MRPTTSRIRRTAAAAAASALLVVACGGGSAVSPAGSPTVAPAATPVATQAAAGQASADAPSTPGPGDPSTPGPGDPWIAYQWDDGAGGDTVWLVRPDGTGAHVLTTDLEGRELHPEWAPDGTSIAFIRELPNGRKPLWAINPDGTGALEIATCELPCNMLDGPQWLHSDPGGIWLQHDADVTPAGPPATLMISRFDLRTQTLEPRYTRTTERSVDNPRISPDGTRAVYEGHPDIFGGPAGSALFVVDLATGEERQLTDWSLEATAPDWLTNDTIVFNTCGLTFDDCPAGPMNLYRVHADGSGLAQLTRFTDPHTGVAQPRVTPDGSSILVVIVDDAHGVVRHIGRINPDGSGLESISTSQVGGTHPVLRPTP